MGKRQRRRKKDQNETKEKIITNKTEKPENNESLQDLIKNILCLKIMFELFKFEDICFHVFILLTCILKKLLVSIKIYQK